ncbi:MAG TPA: hypothetical protein VIU38_01490, partial [Anaerolineales bacterium]
GLVPTPVSLYGVVMLLAAAAYYILVRALLRSHPSDWMLARVIGSDYKGKVSLLLYALGVGLSYVQPLIGWALYVVVDFMWLVPDTRIEKLMGE